MVGSIKLNILEFTIGSCKHYKSYNVSPYGKDEYLNKRNSIRLLLPRPLPHTPLEDLSVSSGDDRFQVRLKVEYSKTAFLLTPIG